jgi:diguanylate cyclase (GGDEF)-like protein/PAS domain S-box-containing protein
MAHIVVPPVINFADLLLDAVCMVDGGGRFVFVSAACERIFGFTQQEMIGKAMIDFVAPADRARTLAAAQNIMAGKSHINFENRYLRKDGSIAHIMWSARWSEHDQLRVAVARDVTALKQAQAMQAVLYAISEAAHASDDLEDLFQRSHAIIAELLPASGFGVALFDTPDRQLRFSYYMDDETAPDAPLMQLLCEEVVRRAAPLLLEAGATDVLPAPLQAAANAMTGAALAVPLTTPEGIVGAIVLRCATDGARDRVRERDLLLFVANQLAATIQRKQLHTQMRFMAMHDELTRLPNRRLFNDRFDVALGHACRHKEGLSLLFIDVNGFKHVNDRYGHACGDRLLQQVARGITACLRATDTLARLGGDEFVVLLEKMALPSDARLVVDKIHAALAVPVEVGAESQLQVSVSIGVAHYPEHGDNRQALMSHADQTMYAAKAVAPVPGAED